MPRERRHRRRRGTHAREAMSNYPQPFAALVAGRVKRPLGDLVGRRNFGVNRTLLPPGAASALHHVHSRQNALIYVVQGEPTLFTDAEPLRLRSGMVAAFPAHGIARNPGNRTERDCIILEFGDRIVGDEGRHPDDDLAAVLGADGRWRFIRKDGTFYEA